MPELPEGLAHYLTTKLTLKSLGTASRQIKAIHCDHTSKESTKAQVPTGIFQKLGPSPRIHCGQCSDQTPLLAEALQDIAGNPPPIPITDLEIKKPTR